VTRVCFGWMVRASPPNVILLDLRLPD
jgi:hypothetical protein